MFLIDLPKFVYIFICLHRCLYSLIPVCFLITEISHCMSYLFPVQICNFGKLFLIYASPSLISCNYAVSWLGHHPIDRNFILNPPVAILTYKDLEVFECFLSCFYSIILEFIASPYIFLAWLHSMGLPTLRDELPALAHQRKVPKNQIHVKTHWMKWLWQTLGSHPEYDIFLNLGDGDLGSCIPCYKPNGPYKSNLIALLYIRFPVDSCCSVFPVPIPVMFWDFYILMIPLKSFAHFINS